MNGTSVKERQTDRQAGRSAARKAILALALLVIGVLTLFFIEPAGLYLWVKAVHVIAIIAWMAGLLYLPRLFIYHCDAPQGSQQALTFAVMERRLLKVIMTPAMVIAWLLGLWLAWSLGFQGWWLWLKLLAVVALSAVHIWFAGAVKMFAEDRNQRTPRQWRMINEIPTILMIIIVILVVVKPF